MLLVFYFFIMRPQQKRSQDQRTFLAKLKKGDHIVTIGGIHGKVHSVSEQTITLEIDGKGTKLTVARGAISWDATQKLLTAESTV